ncbi:MAG: hypothetical protein Q7S66_05425 [bacterium]|nr:hypothetical protein [bacterium]
MKAVIATTTFFKKVDEIRATLALRTIKKAISYGYPIVVVDGGSPMELRNRFVAEGAALFEEKTQGMGPSRRQAMAEASKLANNDGCVIWMEPEKHTLIPELYKTVEPIFRKEADLVIPKRMSLASYPKEQELAELMGNLAFYYITKHGLDPWFGPRVANQRALQFFLEYKGDYGDRWDSIFIPVLRAITAKLKVVNIEVSYAHPTEQATEESGDIPFLIKRIEQLLNIVPALKTEWQKLHPIT